MVFVRQSTPYTLTVVIGVILTIPIFLTVRPRTVTSASSLRFLRSLFPSLRSLFLSFHLLRHLTNPFRTKRSMHRTLLFTFSLGILQDYIFPQVLFDGLCRHIVLDIRHVNPRRSVLQSTHGKFGVGIVLVTAPIGNSVSTSEAQSNFDGESEEEPEVAVRMSSDGAAGVFVEIRGRPGGYCRGGEEAEEAEEEGGDSPVFTGFGKTFVEVDCGAAP
ncbi:hypothetical protein C8R42DRAFT_409314 [Lentinula raphanica]|nr:hypothetical protein C8R42DRAFT_409314 [Lentinula raphanica]